MVRVGIWKPGTWAEAGGSFSEPHGAALSLWLVLRLWLGRTGEGTLGGPDEVHTVAYQLRY